MEILVKNISDIIVAEVKAINYNVKGLNFLEILKLNTIEKLQPLLHKTELPLDKNFESIKEIENNIFISIKYFTEPLSINKKTIEYDSLFISINETANLDIYQDKNKYTSIVLHTNKGVSLPKGTFINFRYNKNFLLLEIQNKNIEQTLIK